jgi:hypothetical protein
MKRLFLSILSLSVTSSIALADNCTETWNDSGNWAHQQSVANEQECIEVANSIGREHCLEVASGSPAEDPNGVYLTAKTTSSVPTDSDAMPFRFYYSCN